MFDFCCQTAFCWLTAFSWAEKKHHHRIISPRCCRNRCHVLSQVFTLKPKYSTRYHFNFIYKSLKPHTVDLFLFFFPIPANSFRSAECIFNVMVVSPTQTCLRFSWSLVWRGFNIYNLNKGPSAGFFCVEYLAYINLPEGRCQHLLSSYELNWQ